MNVTVDTNILVRAALRDDVPQAAAAAKLLREAEVIAVPLPCLCEFIWVLRQVYKIGLTDIGVALRALLGTANVAVNRGAVDAGLAMLDAGGDFADGLVEFEGRWLGGEVFVSFDKRAVGLLEKQGMAALVLV